MTNNTKCYINDNLYFFVDEKRRTLPEETLEGTLGFVIKLHSASGQSFHFALKIPKLHGATHRENAYINQLMEFEELAAVRVGGDKGLVIAESQIKAFRSELNTRGATEVDAVALHGCTYLIQYKPGKNPKFDILNPNSHMDSTVFKDSEILEKIKELSKNTKSAYFSSTIFVQAQEDDESTALVETLDLVNEHSKTNHTDQAQEDNESTALDEKLDLNDGNHRVNYFDQWTAAEIYSSQNTYYAFVPSVVYRWASGTLQDAITRQAKGKWSIQKYIAFLNEIGKGIESLHEKSFIHGDIRPANIMYFGDMDRAPKEPETYKLGDYGSFASASEEVLNMLEPGGETKLARAFEGERISEFYSPERVSGIERETVDKAYILPKIDKRKKSRYLWVVLGLRNQPLMQKYELVEEIVNKLDKLNPTTTHNEGESILSSDEDFEYEPALPDQKNEVDINGPSHDNKTEENSHQGKHERTERAPNDKGPGKMNADNLLMPRDRIQIQNYIFELRDTELNKSGLQIFKSDSTPTQVVQKRIAVDTNPEDIPEIMAVDRVIELKQWAAAVDIYSLGVLTLYVIFMDQFQLAATLEITDVKKAEDTFREMVRYLASKDYFVTLWPQLEAFRHGFDNHSEFQNLCDLDFPENDYAVKSEVDIQNSDSGEIIESVTLQEDGNSANKSKTTNYKTFALSLTSRITAYVPGAKRLIEQLNNNVALFLLFLHFTLCCLHKESHVSEKALSPWMEDPHMKPIFPFAKDRIERVEKFAIKKALSRLKELNMLVNNAAVKGFNLTDQDMEEIPDYNPGNPGMVLFNKLQLEKKIKDIQKDIQKFVEEKDNDNLSQVIENDFENKYQASVGEHRGIEQTRFKKFLIPKKEQELITVLEDLKALLDQLKNQYQTNINELNTKHKDHYRNVATEIEEALDVHGQPEQN